MFTDPNRGLNSCGVNDLYQLGIPDSPPQAHIKNLDELNIINNKVLFFHKEII